jgi:hypothetical protein
MDRRILWFEYISLNERCANNVLLGVQPTDGDQAQGKKKNADIELLINDQGYPVLPSWEEIDPKGHAYKKALIGAFMREMYRESTAVFSVK